MADEHKGSESTAVNSHCTMDGSDSKLSTNQANDEALKSTNSSAVSGTKSEKDFTCRDDSNHSSQETVISGIQQTVCATNSSQEDNKTDMSVTASNDGDPLLSGSSSHSAEGKDHGNHHLDMDSDEHKDSDIQTDSCSAEHKDSGLLDMGADSSSASFQSPMKKDDSGIIVERSPTHDDDPIMVVMHSTPVDEQSGNRSQLSVRVDRPSTSNESEGVVADMEPSEDNEQAEGSDQVIDPETGAKPDLPLSSSSDSSNNSDSADQEVVVRRTISARQRRLQRILRSDSEENSTDDSMDRDASNHESDSDDNFCLEEDTGPPPDTWRPLQEVLRRERGYSNRTPVSSIFRRRCGGSVNLVRRLQMYAALEKHDGCVNALHFNEQGTLLASGSDDLDIVVWKWMEKKPYFSFESGHRSNVFQSKFMPCTGDTHIVSCARDGQLRLAELSSTGTCKATRKLAQHRGPAHKLALLQDSSHTLYSCGEDAVVFEVDLRQEKPNRLSMTKEGGRKIPLYSIHSNPCRTYEYCASGRDHFIRVFDKRMCNDSENSGLVKKYCPHHLNNDNHYKANVTCSVYSYNGQEIIGTYNDEDIYLFDNSHSDGANFVHRYTGHRNNATVKGVNFYGPQSEFIVSGSDCGNIFVWEKQSTKIINYFKGDDGGVVNVLEPHPHAPFLATSGLDHDIKIWMPLAKEMTDLDGLKRITRRNKKERDEELQEPAHPVDSSVFWRLMQHFRRSSRRRERQEGADVSSDTESDSQDSDRPGGASDEDDDNPALQCVPS